MVEMGETRACGGRIWEELTTERIGYCRRRSESIINLDPRSLFFFLILNMR